MMGRADERDRAVAIEKQSPCSIRPLRMEPVFEVSSVFWFKSVPSRSERYSVLIAFSVLSVIS